MKHPALSQGVKHMKTQKENGQEAIKNTKNNGAKGGLIGLVLDVTFPLWEKPLRWVVKGISKLIEKGDSNG